MKYSFDKCDQWYDYSYFKTLNKCVEENTLNSRSSGEKTDDNAIDRKKVIIGNYFFAKLSVSLGLLSLLTFNRTVKKG